MSPASIQWKAILIGLFADIAGSAVGAHILGMWGSLIFIANWVMKNGVGGDVETLKTMAQDIGPSLSESVLFLAVLMVIRVFFSAFGCFMTGMLVARGEEWLNVAVTIALAQGLGLLSVLVLPDSSIPTLYYVVSFLVAILLGMVGGSTAISIKEAAAAAKTID